MKRVLSIFLLTLLTCYISGCGGGDSSSPSSPTTPTATTTTSTPPPPPNSIGPGTHRVGSDIESGRYFSDPDSGCYWERLKGFGGSVSTDVIANEFVGFDAMQWIVQIAPSDAGFKTDEDCGRWYKENPRHGEQSDIHGGVWLVGRQVAAGTYEANSTGSCYWERLRGFGGTVSEDVISNDFVGNPGRVIVTIRSGDLGFMTDEDCGVWSRVAAQTVNEDAVEQTEEEKAVNREAYRQNKR